MPRFYNNIIGQSTVDCTGANTGAAQLLGGLYVAKQVQTWGQMTLNANIASTTALNGTLVIANSGGLGVGGNVNIGGTETVSGLLTANSGIAFGGSTAAAPGTMGLQSINGLEVWAANGSVNDLTLTNPGNSAIYMNVPHGSNIPNFAQGVTVGAQISAQAGLNIQPVANPASGSLALITAAGNLGVGVYYYNLAFQTAMGVTNAYQIGSITTDASHKQVQVTIPTSTDSRVTSRVLYRTVVNGNYWTTYQLAVIGDNVTTTFTDNVADGSLVTLAGFGQLNTTSNFITINGSRAMTLDTSLTAFGMNVGGGSAGAWQNSFFGYQAGLANTIGQENAFFGYEAGEMNSTGSANSYFGYNAGTSVTTGVANTAVGNNAMTGIGLNSTWNTVMGYYAMANGPGTGTANYNTAIGLEAGYNYTASGGLFLGAYAGKYESTVPQVMILDMLDRSSQPAGRANALISGVANATPASQTLQLGGGGAVTIPGTLAVQSKVSLVASVAGAATMNVPNGVTVTAPVAGDMWAVGGSLYYYTGSATVNLTTTGSGMANPMTTNGDMIVEAGGVPARLPAGTNGNVLTMVSGAPAWAASAAGTPISGGTAILDFGTGAGAASIAITGQTNILTTSNVQVTVAAVSTSNKSADEIYLDPIVVMVGPPTNGTGFTIYGTALNKFTSGQYQVNWSWF